MIGGVVQRGSVLAASLVLAAAAAAAEPDAALSARVDRYLDPLVSARQFSGVVLVSRGDRVLVHRAYGKADWELDAPMLVSSRFRIASITKTFTGAAIVMLAEQGKVQLTDPLSKWLPGFPAGDKIQLRHLLLHSSGVPNPDSPPCSGASLDDLVAEVAKKPLWFEPGTRSGYSNGGYAVLAKVIENVSGKTWEAYLEEAIFRPLGLTATLRDTESGIVPRRASAYVPGPSSLGIVNAPCSGAQGALGGGALLSTAGDLRKWARAVRGETLFKRAALEHPYGWGARTYFERAAIEQSGILNGSSSYLAAYLQDDVVIVVLSNIQSGLLVDVGKGVAALTFGQQPKTLPAAPAAMPTTPPQRATFIARWTNPDIGTFRLVEDSGALRQFWGNSSSGSHVRMTGERSAYNVQDAIALQLDGDALRLTWSDGSQHEFKRVASP